MSWGLAILQRNYIRFLSCNEDKISKPFFVQQWETKENFSSVHVKIFNIPKNVNISFKDNPTKISLSDTKLLVLYIKITFP